MASKKRTKRKLAGFFIILMIIILSAFFIFKAISFYNEKSCQTSLIQFESDLKESMSAISSQTGTVEQKQYSVPCKIDKVYFIDLNEELDSDFDPDEDNENIEIKDSYDAGVQKNVFFMKDGKVTDSLYVPELKLKYPAYRCFDMLKRPRIDFYLEGYSGGANVVNIDDSANCGYIPVEMWNESVNDDVLEGRGVDPGSQNDARSAIKRALDDPTIKKRIEDTRKNVFIGRKVDIKKTGTGIKIRIKPEKGKTASDFTYVESIPKGCIELLTDYLADNGDGSGKKIFDDYPYIDLINDPVIVWNFDEDIQDKKEVEYELTSPEDCMRIINSLGFGEIS